MRPDLWRCERDERDDYRAWSSDGQYRTRLKDSYAAAMHDAAIGRLQRRQGNVWIDDIDGVRNRYTMPATEQDTTNDD